MAEFIITNALVPVNGTEISTILSPDLDKAAELARQEKALATRRAYSSDFRIFESVPNAELAHYRPRLRRSQRSWRARLNTAYGPQRSAAGSLPSATPTSLPAMRSRPTTNA